MGSTIYQDMAEKWARDHLSEDFQFREYQLETIGQILENKLNKTKTQVIEAPTGFGKSITAFIVAGVLWEEFHERSYILVSDLSLFEQYEKDLDRFKLPWGHLKGKDNYQCIKNGNSFSGGECQMSGIGFNALKDNQSADVAGFACARNCKYIQMRKLAQRAPVTVMTYQMWFIAMTTLANGDNTIGFDRRNFVICDEAHKIPDIVQSQFSPKLDSDGLGAFLVVKDFADKNGIDVTEVDDIINTLAVMHKADNPDFVLKCVKHLRDQLCSYADDSITSSIKNFVKATKNKQSMRLFNSMTSTTELYRRVEEYNSIIDVYSSDAIVKTSNLDKEGHYHITLECAYEDKLVKHYLHDIGPQELMLSATIGDPDIFRDMIGLHDCLDIDFKGYKVPSTFNFEKSPIYYNTQWRMSYKEKEKSLPHVIEQITKICHDHPNERGLIQVTSYDISKAIVAGLPYDIRSRLVYYNDSKEKMEALARMKNSVNKILIGCSLWEGLDFKDDMARFLIIAKMPYASLGSLLVKRKMDLIPGYYSNDVCQKLTQGVGRIIRSPEDWGITYILDGCFNDILKRNPEMLPKEGFTDRLVKIVSR